MSNQNDSSIKQITDYMFIPDAIIEADATLVLGMTLWHRPLMKAFELHRDGLAGMLVFSGGLNPKLGQIEASQMKARWTELGHSTDRVLIDCQSVHTLENMVHSKRLLEEHGLYKKHMRINLIAINYHMRRAVETFRAVFSADITLGIVNYPSVHCQPLDWFNHSEGKKLILNELKKIKLYLPETNSPDVIND
jgi:uncharacterized SAM-binding protein YcdF (DUF218 family)